MEICKAVVGAREAEIGVTKLSSELKKLLEDLSPSLHQFHDSHPEDP